MLVSLANVVTVCFLEGGLCVWVGKPLLVRCRLYSTTLNTIEKFHIYTEFKNDNHLNDEHTVAPNKIFDTLLKPQ